MATVDGEREPCLLKDFVEQNELPAVVEVVSVDQDGADDSLQVGAVFQLVRTVQELEITLDPDYVVPTKKADRIVLPLDYEGTFQTVPFYGEDYVFETAEDLLQVSPRFVKAGVGFVIPGVTEVRAGDILEVLGRVQCADDNIYLKCQHQTENRDIFLPLTFTGRFKEVKDPSVYTVGEIHSRLPQKVKFSRETLSERRSGQLPIKGVATDLNEEFLLQTVTTVEIVRLVTSNQCSRLLIDLPIKVISRIGHGEEDFAQEINIHDIKKSGDQLPLVVKVTDQAPVIPGVPFSLETLLQVHSFKFARRILVATKNDSYFLFPERCDKKCRLQPKTFATARDLWQQRVKTPVRSTKSWTSCDEDFGSVEKGDVLNIRGASDVDNNETAALICTRRESASGRSGMLKLQMDAIGDFVELEPGECNLSEFQPDQLPVTVELLQKPPGDLKHSDELATGQPIRLCKMIESCAVIVSLLDDGPNAQNTMKLYEILEEFPLSVIPLRKRPCRVLPEGFHHEESIEKLTTYQLEMLLANEERDFGVGDDGARPKSPEKVDGQTYAVKNENARVSEEEVPDRSANVDTDNDGPLYYVLEQSEKEEILSAEYYVLEQSEKEAIIGDLATEGATKSPGTGQPSQDRTVTDVPEYFQVVLEVCDEEEQPCIDEVDAPDKTQKSDFAVKQTVAGQSYEVLGETESDLAKKRQKRVGKRRSRLGISLVEEGEQAEEVLIEAPKEEPKKTPLQFPPKDGDISRYTMRELGMFLRFLSVREEVITRFYADRIDGNDCCRLPSSLLKQKYNMNPKEVQLLERYINRSKMRDDRDARNIYHLS